jgi:hypothetical protein
MSLEANLTVVGFNYLLTSWGLLRKNKWLRHLPILVWIYVDQ